MIEQGTARPSLLLETAAQTDTQSRQRHDNYGPANAQRIDRTLLLARAALLPTVPGGAEFVCRGPVRVCRRRLRTKVGTGAQICAYRFLVQLSIPSMVALGNDCRCDARYRGSSSNPGSRYISAPSLIVLWSD